MTVGTGSSALIRDLVTALCGPGDEVVFAQPSFPYYRNATVVAGATAVPVPLREFVHDPDALLAAVTPATRLLFLCNPNNPTGTVFPPTRSGRSWPACPSTWWWRSTRRTSSTLPPRRWPRTWGAIRGL